MTPRRAKRRKLILDTFEDSMDKFLYYDRKEDRELPVDSIDKAIKQGIVEEEDFIRILKKHLRNG